MVSPIRSKIMSSIRSKDTKPEILLRRELHRLGFRYRLHYQKLPGKPDIVLPKYRAIILVNGCFWHGHDCHLFNPSRKLNPKWSRKIENNRLRDLKNLTLYEELGWKVIVVWECAITGKTKRPIEALASNISYWIKNGPKLVEIAGYTAEDR